MRYAGRRLPSQRAGFIRVGQRNVPNLAQPAARTLRGLPWLWHSMNGMNSVHRRLVARQLDSGGVDSGPVCLALVAAQGLDQRWLQLMRGLVAVDGDRHGLLRVDLAGAEPEGEAADVLRLHGDAVAGFDGRVDLAGFDAGGCRLE